jgi:predicted MFS family arabinose efflux permease
MVLAVTGAARSGFGSVRVWGSLGWAVLVLFSGWLIQKTSLQSGFLSASAGYLLAALLLLWIGSAHFGKPRTPGDARPDTSRLLRSRTLAGVGLMIVFTGFANSGVLQFEPVFMDRLGAREGLIGVASMLGSIVELPCMFWADRLAGRRGSHFLLLLSMLVYAILRTGVFLAPGIPAILLERAGGGVAFSFYAVSLVKFISEQAPEGQTGAALALYTVTFASLVNIIATPLTGMAYDHFGMTPLYALAALGYLGSWLALRLTHRPGEYRAQGPALLSSPAREDD